MEGKVQRGGEEQEIRRRKNEKETEKRERKEVGSREKGHTVIRNHVVI